MAGSSVSEAPATAAFRHCVRTATAGMRPQERALAARPIRAASSLSAASRRTAVLTCVYVSSVTAVVECPSISLMVLGSTPSENKSDAAEWRRS